jgi:predicted Zn finger-like uncharacterized protein
MIIQCPACSSRYRIRPEKLPSDGGNIKCPTCAHVFFVSADQAASSSAGISSGPGSSGPGASSPFASQPTTPVPNAGAGASEPLASAPSAAPASLRWKVRNDIGLVFDFTETDQLKRWLSSRDSVAGLDASCDGGTTWKALKEHPELAGVQPGGRRTIMGMGPVTLRPPGSDSATTTPNEAGASAAASPARPASPPAGLEARPPAPTAEELRQQAAARLEEARKARKELSGQIDLAEAPTEKRPTFQAVRPARSEVQEQTSRTIYLVAAILLPLLAVVALNIAGVIDLREVTASWTAPRSGPDLPPPTPARPAVGPGIPSGGIDEAVEVVELTPQQRASQFVLQAAAAYEAGELPNAAALLERALHFDPDNRPAACELAKVYREAEQPAQAESAQRRCDGVPEGGGSDQAGPATGNAPADGEPPTAPDDGATPPN